MKKNVTRRDFLQATLLSSAGVLTGLPGIALRAGTSDSPNGICVTLANHWSYIGIGWQLGIESNVLSVTDAMEMADRPPHVKTCINLDARAYEFMAEKFPEVTERLKKYLAEGKVELIGGTYGQPLGTMFSGESNIRQIVYGRETIRKALGYEMVTFLEEEEFTHPQIPQIAMGAGFKYASLAQVDTWGKAGIPILELISFNWKGTDGTIIPTTPKNSLYSGWSADPKAFAATLASPVFKKLQALGKPLVFAWEEFGWEPHDEPAYLTSPQKYQKFVEQFAVEFVTLAEYMDKYGKNPRETVYLNMDSWKKLLTWGLGGDQLRILDRKVEGTLLAAERFDAVASSLGAKSRAEDLTRGWKNLLASQSHDVSLCEYSRWQGDRMAPLDRLEDYHNFTWGGIGYNHLDAAMKDGKAVLDASLDMLVKRIDSQSGKQGQKVVTVFNPSGWERTEIVTTGRIYPLPDKMKGVVVKDSTGRVMPSQVLKREVNGEQNLVTGEVAFRAEKVPSIGYDTYYLEFISEDVVSGNTELKVDTANLTMENSLVKVTLNPKTGAVISLVDKRTGQEMLDAQKSAFPVFNGRANPEYRLRVRKKDNVEFDSSSSQAEIRWIEKGPLRATVKARHNWHLLKFETYVTLYDRVPYVEVTSRVLADVPPAPDALDKKNRFPAEIKEGYWFSFAPNFPISSVVRDFPLAIEATEKSYFQALTFVDLVGENSGLLVLHPGTQYFKRDSNQVISNLVMREWESYFSKEFGWPRYSEYRHVLLPHGLNFTNADRLRAAEQFSHKMITVVGDSTIGNLPKRNGFLSLSPENTQLLALRKKESGGIELRVVESEGRETTVSIGLAWPVMSAVETNLLGKKVEEVLLNGSSLSFQIQPWRIRTFALT